MTEPNKNSQQKFKEIELKPFKKMSELLPIETDQLNASRYASIEILKQRQEAFHSSNIQLFNQNMATYHEMITEALKPMESAISSIQQLIKSLDTAFPKEKRDYIAKIMETMRISLEVYNDYKKEQQPFSAWMEKGWILTIHSEVSFRKSFEKGEDLTDELAIELLEDVNLIEELSHLIGNENEQFQDIAFCFEHKRYSLACLALMERLESRITRAQLDSGIRLDKVKIGKSGLSVYLEEFLRADATAIDIHRFIGIEKMTTEIFKSFPKDEEAITPLNRNLLFHGLAIEKVSKVEALKLLCLFIAIMYLEQGLLEVANS